MDGLSGSSSMRLNFAGVPDDDIREGIRRIGRTLGPDTGLLGTLTGSGRSGTAGGRGTAGGPGKASDAGTAREDALATPSPELADVLELPRRPDRGRAREQGR
jgi:2-aminoadipate transaminase